MTTKSTTNASVRVEKAFLQRLFKAKEVPMTDFMNEVAPLNQDKGKGYLESLLMSWSVGGFLIQVRRQGSDEVEDQFAEALASPSDYWLVVDDIEEAENDLVTANWQPVPGSKADIDEGLFSLDVRALESVLIVGDEEEGMLMHERIRAFTQLMAARLLQHDFDHLESALHVSWGNKGGIAALKEQYRLVEEEHGGFEYADNLNVLSVYAGEGGDRKVFDEMKLPKGVKRAQRRGSSMFKLISRVSPNGMPLLHAVVFMEVIAEEGEFKIVNLEFRSNL